MLPSSHFQPIKARRTDSRSDGPELLLFEDGEREQNGSGHLPEARGEGASFLANEFSEFILAASQLETSYRALQQEVAVLGNELSERNVALNSSLAENEQMRRSLQQIVDSMPCGVLVLDCNGTITMINPETRRLLGLDQQDFNDESAMTLGQISTVCGINLETACEETSSNDAGQEFSVRDSSGRRWMEVRKRSLFRLNSKETQPDQTILILRDITARKRSEQERETGRKAMALAEITTILAHEIRNPLGSLELFAELIEKDDSRRAEWISNLRAGIRSLSGMVNNVLGFHSSASLALEPVSLSELIGNALHFIQPMADQAAVTLNWSAGHDNAIVLGNESALQQVVLNLVSNAIRHTPSGGMVTVSIRLEDSPAGSGNDNDDSEQVIVEFCDTGCGIAADQISRIFEPGFSGSGHSSGLGLTVCDRIMKQHSGRISASNVTGSGARFTLQFPQYQVELATA